MSEAIAKAVDRTAENLVDVLRHRARTQPTRAALTFLADGESQETTWNYADLDREARRIAGCLKRHALPGERALLVFSPSLEYVAAFYGCLYAGVVAVPTYHARLNRSSSKLLSVLADCDAAVVLTTTRTLRDFPRSLGGRTPGSRPEWIALEEIGDEQDVEPVRLDRDAIAFLQYTSGSTSAPRGVMVSHANLLHNLASIARHFGGGPDERAVTWLPPYHDMGLIGGVLEPIYAGCPVTILPPLSFVQRPFRWLRAITQYRATISGAPNFAYDLCVERIRDEKKKELDLSSWQVAFNGAEPIRPETLDRFASAFEQCGFRREALHPCYGLAESTLLVTSARRGVGPYVRAFQARSIEQGTPVVADNSPERLVSSGAAVDGQRVVIVDPSTGLETLAGQIGEIWISGPSVACGYWNRPDDTEATFRATLVGQDATFLRTGDLGFLQDGELFVTGRQKDLVIIRGKNHYPQDIENTATESHPSLAGGRGAAFSIDQDGLERLVVVHEVADRSSSTFDEICASIARAVAEGHELETWAVVLVGHHRVPKTSSGKIQRRLCREMFLAGKLHGVLAVWRGEELRRERKGDVVRSDDRQPLPTASPRTAAEIQEWMVSRLAGHWKTDPSQIDVRQGFSTFGLDSVAMVGMVGELESWLGRSLSPTLAWDYPTIESLARHLAGESVARSRQRPSATAEPIAIVGMACRFPGCRNLDEYWRVMREGASAIREVPRDRWDIDDLFDADPDTPGKMVTRWGGFLDDIDQFDAQFFGISPREAARMDPQQRMLLEVSWEALENAGLPAERVSGSKTGVFVGIGGTDYSQIYRRFENPREYLDPYSGTGNALSIAANRVSYVLDLHGPSLAIDTACSSALVAIHYACQSLANGECDAALAGGVNAILTPEVTIAFSKARMLSPDGQCKTFDESANGYVRGEGCGIVVLKRLTDAQRDGDEILAVLRGTAVNQDGKTTGITAPNGPAQQECVRKALERAGVLPTDVTYIEAHGTGTPLGDPIEVQALRAVVGDPHDDAPPCHLGSIKPNIGHLETASGAAGLIRVVLMMRHGWIPPQRNFTKLNPHIKLDGSRLRIATKPTRWSGSEGERLVAGVSGFGFGGTNAHLVVENYRPPAVAIECRSRDSERPKHLLAISAQSEAALREYATRFARHLSDNPELSIADVCYSAATARTALDTRLAIEATTREELQHQLESFAREGRGKGVASGTVKLRNKPRIAMLFTGQGSQYPAMAQRLYETQPTFQRVLRQCDEVLAEQLEYRLLDVLFDPEKSLLIDQTAYTQPALFAVEYALAELWKSWGIQPTYVHGHSVGEYVAACVAGVMSPEDGLRLIAKRARRMQSLPTKGGMAVVFAPEAHVADVLDELGVPLSIAAVNGPDNTVLSGHKAPLAEAIRRFADEDVRTQRLQVSHAFHSDLLEPMLHEFEQWAEQIRFRAPSIPMISNRTGRFFADGEVPRARYWREHARGTVRFAEGMETLAKARVDVWLEVGPHPSLLAMGRRCVPAGKALWVASLRKGADDWDVLVSSVANLFVHGVPLNGSGWDRDYPRTRVWLPTYPFQRKRYWMEEDPEKRSGISFGAAPAFAHPLVGTRLPLAVAQCVYATSISLRAVASLTHHVVQGSIVLPGAAYIEAALACARFQFGEGMHSIEDVRLQQALFLTPSKRQPVQMTLSPEVGGSASFAFLSLPDEAAGAWVAHATGSLHRATSNAKPPALSIPFEIREEAELEHDRETLYAKFADRGMEYGPMFRPIDHVWKRGSETLAFLDLHEGVVAELGKFQVHPAVLDGCLQALGAAIPEKYIAGGSGETYLPTGARHVRVFAPPERRMWVHAALTTDLEADGVQVVEGNIQLLSEDGEVLAELLDVTLTRVGTRRAGQEGDRVADLLYSIDWQPADVATPVEWPVGERCLVFADEASFAEGLREALSSRAMQPVVVAPGENLEIADARATVRPGEPDDFRFLVDSSKATHVVFAWGVDSAGKDPEGVLERSAGLLHVVLALDSLGAAPIHLTIVTRRAQHVAPGESVDAAGGELWGLGRTIANERPDWHVRLVDVSDASAPAMAEELWRRDRENQVALRDGLRFIARLVRARKDQPAPVEREKTALPTSGSYRLEIGAAPTLDRMAYRSFRRQAPGPGDVEIEVAAAALNFSDVLKAMGLYPGLKPGVVPIGIECSGRVVRVGEGVVDMAVGDEVIGIAPFSFATHATTSRLGLVRKPAGLSHEEGATIPVAYLTAYYALCRLARLQPGEKVLIHAAAGGVGMAAIQICQERGAEIFATAGSDEKRELLRSLGVQHVMNSRALDFTDEIRQITQGRGVDVVLNSLPGEAIPKSIECLGAYGRFLEIGKTDIYQNRAIGLYPFQNNLSYFAIDLDKMFRERPEFVREMFLEVVAHFEKGAYRPLARTVFPADETARAFRYMAQRKNVGKIVVTYAPSAQQSEDSLKEGGRAAWITGGLGGLGLELAAWLGDRGEREIVLFGRSEPSAPARERIAELQSRGAHVEIARCDVADRDSLRSAVERLPLAMRQPRSIYHAAGVLDDGVLDQQTFERFQTVVRPKVHGAWNLHEMTREAGVERFVLFSSVAAVFGSPGQGNYAAANSYLDGFAAMRRSRGLPALSLNWGPWAKVGMAARLGEEKLSGRGVRPIEPGTALDALGRLLDSDAGQAVVLDADWDRLGAMYSGGPPPLFAHLSEASGTAQAVDREIKRRVLETPQPERPALLQEYFLQQIARVTELDPAKIDPEQPMNTLGLDSLMAIELKNGIESSLGVSLPMAKFLEGPSAVLLADLVLQQLDAQANTHADVPEQTPSQVTA